VACLPVFVTGKQIARWEGVVFLLYAVAYVTYLLLDASNHEATGAFSVAMLGFALPLTALTLLVLLVRHMRNGGGEVTAGPG
jgi:cation:H+ antiporter